MSKRSLRLVLLGGALLVVAALGLSAVGRARSRAALRAYKASLVARGEKLTIDELAPHLSVGAQQAGQALLQAAQQLRAGVVLPDHAPTPMKFIESGKARVAWRQPNLRLPLRTNTWEQLAAELEANRETLQQIREALKGPEIGFNLDYHQGGDLLVPHLSVIKRVAQRLSATALYELHEGRCGDAAADLEAMLTLIGVWREEPLLLSELVRISVAQIAFGTTWEILQADGWTDAQLAAIQRRWETLEFLTPARRAVDMERAVGLHIFDRVRRSGDFRRRFFDDGSSAPWPTLPSEFAALLTFMLDMADRAAAPQARRARERRWLRSWSYIDERMFLQAFEAVPPAWQSVQAGRPFAAAYRQMSSDVDEFQRQAASAARCPLTILLTVNLAQFFRRVGQSETERELAVAAIALKRYHLRHGWSAPNLAALVPEFLPHIPRDIMDGGDLRYRLNPDGTWILYSVGENGVDDGGDPDSPRGQARAESFTRGRDAVWPQPATPEEIARVETTTPPLAPQRMSREMMKRYGLIPRE